MIAGMGEVQAGRASLVTGIVARSRRSVPNTKGAWRGRPPPCPHLLLGLDPHVLGPLLAVLSLVGAACLALGRLQPRGPWSHHLHGWHAATATLQEEREGWGWRVLVEP